MNSIVKLSDIIAGTAATLIAILYIAPEASWFGSRVMLIIASLAGLASGWYVSQERHWIMKLFLYAGMMVLCIFIVDIAQRLILKLLA